MADEPAAIEPGDSVTIEVAPEEKKVKPQLSDEEVAKLAEPVPEDEVARYAKDAQKRIKNLHIVADEWKRRVFQASKDMATATSLAEQLYKENQELRASQARGETALVEQAVARAEAQLAQAKARLRSAYAGTDAEAIVAANEEMARYVAEVDRLKLLRPQPGAAPAQQPGAPAPPPPPQRRPNTPRTDEWLSKNPWFGQPGEEEISGFAMAVDKALEKQGITEASNADLYWGTIDRRLREVYPQRFAAGAKPDAAEPARRLVNVAGAPRVNGGAAPAPGPRKVTLTESQLRVARTLGVTPEQYALQVLKIEDESARRKVQ